MIHQFVKAAIYGIAVISITGCSGISGGNIDEAEGVASFSALRNASLRDLLRQVGKSETASAQDGLTWSGLKETGESFAFVEVPKTGAAAAFALSRTQGDREYWRGAGEQGFTTNKGVVVASYGFQDDRFAAKALRVTSQMSGQSYGKSIAFLNGAEQLETIEMLCMVQSPQGDVISILDRQIKAQLVTENCKWEDGEVINSYWFDAGNALVGENILLTPAVGGVQFRYLRQ